jgi:LacI family transcriptional regulator
MVSEETQERVRGLADELGYEANPIARALASGRTGMIGILGPSLEDLWQQRLVAQAGRVLLEYDRFALILDAGGDAGRQRALAGQLRDQQVDGLIISPVDPSDPSWAEIVAAVPVVVVGDTFAEATARAEVLYDNRAGVRMAFTHLHELGHRRIAVLRPPGSPTNDRPAELVVAEEAQRLGLEVHGAEAGYGLRDATDCARELLNRSPRPTAAFCFADGFAAGTRAV